MQSPEDHARAALRETVRARADLLSLAANLAVPRAGERCWLRVADCEEFDAWLISWGADSAIDPHDHGDSAGGLQVVRGRLIELSREPGDALMWSARELVPGTPIDIPRGRVHQIENPDPEPALSLHVYSPPLAELEFYPQLALAGTVP